MLILNEIEGLRNIKFVVVLARKYTYGTINELTECYDEAPDVVGQGRGDLRKLRHSLLNSN